MFSSRTKIVLGLLAVVVAGSIVTVFLNSSGGGISPDFVAARLQGALIAQTIVDLSSQSSKDLETIGTLNRERRFQEALALTSQVLEKSRDIRDRATELSKEIEKMTIALSSITSLEARQAALEAISNRLALITRLINYSTSLSKLLETLEQRLNGIAVPGANITALLNDINAEVNAINSFNDQATRAMERFDRFMSK